MRHPVEDERRDDLGHDGDARGTNGELCVELVVRMGDLPDGQRGAAVHALRGEKRSCVKRECVAIFAGR